MAYFYYMHSMNVSSRHLSMQTHPKLIVKKELVLSYGNILVVSVFGASTLNVAQQPSNFSNLNTVLVVVTAGSLLIGIAIASLPEPQVYIVTGLVLKNRLLLWPKNPLSQVSRQQSFWQTLCCNIWN